MAIIGRIQELKTLHHLKKKNSASLVCLLGRRRIGKSTLIEEFGKGFKKFLNIQGLAPGPGSNNQIQLNNFSTQLSYITNQRKIHFLDWSDAFFELAQTCAKGDCLILLDEISWMGGHDPLFTSKLKLAWDTLFKKNPHLIIVLCGSVSSWIENNILKNMNFEGRISLEINLQQLSLQEISQFLDQKKHSFGILEKITIASVTGGVPKYLEEINNSEDAYTNLARICFDPGGILYNDYDKIFTEIFQRKSKSLEKIVKGALLHKLGPKELALKLKMDYNSDFLEYLHILELSGFISRDYYFNPQKNAETMKFSHIRLKDNYLRFYLKIIAPLKKSLSKGGRKITSMTEIKHFESIQGLQFENLMLFNRQLIHKALKLKDQDVLSSAPYFQRKKENNKGSCQIDLLIHTLFDIFYLCEFKCQKVIDIKVIKEVDKKINLIKVSRRSSIKPILIYAGEIPPTDLIKLNDFFYQIISVEELLSNLSPF